MPSAVASWSAAAASSAMDDAQFPRCVDLLERRTCMVISPGRVAAVPTRMREAGKVNFQACATAGTHE
jgi:hypothetical protein